MRFTRHAVRGLAAASLGLACLPAQAAFLLADVPAESTQVDYRVGQVLPDAQQLALAVNLGATRVNWNRFGTVHSMIRHGGYLASGYGGSEVEAARQFILDNSALFRLSPAGVAGLSDELRERGLAQRLALVHANDSVFERGARRDRHADIGDGQIGPEGWRALVNDLLIGSVPWVLETPGDVDRQRL